MLNDSAAPKPAPGLDTGLACLVMSVRFHSVAASPEQLTHEYAQDGRLFGRPEILLAAMKLGFKTKPARSSLSRLTLTPSLAIAVDTGGRFFIIVRMDQSRALIQDSHSRQPGAARPGASRVSMEGGAVANPLGGIKCLGANALRLHLLRPRDHQIPRTILQDAACLLDAADLCIADATFL